MPDAERRLRLRIEGNANPLKGSLTELNSALSLLKQGAEVLQQVWAATGKKALDLGNQIDDLQRATGMTAEETSKLITVFGTLGIDTGLLTKAAVSLRKEGLAPDLDTLANLSSEFVKLQDPVAKNTFLFNNFGKAGQEMGELMEKGGEKIRAMAAEAAHLGVVMSEEDVQAAVELQRELNKLEILNQKYLTLLGTKAIPTLSRFATAEVQLTEAVENRTIGLLGANVAMALSILGMGNLTQAISDDSDALERNEQARDDAAAASLQAVSAIDSETSSYAELQRIINGTSEATRGLTADQFLNLAVEAIIAGNRDLAEAYYADYLAAKDHADMVVKVKDELLKLNGTTAHTFIITHTYTQQGNLPPGPYIPWSPPGRAGGADFVVPPGFPNDSYPMRVQSGEHVEVTPAGKAKPSDAGVVAEMRTIRNDIRRMTRQLPIAIRDAVERA